MNIKVLEELKDVLVREDWAFSMDSWVNDHLRLGSTDIHRVAITPSCDTSGCLAGSLALKRGMRMRYVAGGHVQVELQTVYGPAWESIAEWAASELGLDTDQIAEWPLFYVNEWPVHYQRLAGWHDGIEPNRMDEEAWEAYSARERKAAICLLEDMIAGLVWLELVEPDPDPECGEPDCDCHRWLDVEPHYVWRHIEEDACEA